MYINFEILTSKGLTLYELGILQLIKQNKIEDLSQQIESLVSNTQIIEKLSNIGYIEFIKGKKGQTQFQCIRTSKKGNEVLDDISTPNVLEEDLIIAEWLKKIYTESNREIGNFKKTKIYIALFRVNTGISKNALAYLCQSFMDDESQFDWSKKLEFLFFKPSNVYEKFSIDGSKLYQYYLKNENYFLEKFKKWEEQC
jgi:hypothetical protein